MIDCFKSFFICFFVLVSCGWATLPQETVYLTWQRSPCTTMTIQWMSDCQDKQSILNFQQTKEKSDWIKVKGEIIPLPTSQYLLHRVEIEHLQPNTEYTFNIHPYKEQYRFLTAPASLTQELYFVVGGDMYHDAIEFMVNTCKKAAQTNPLFALIGGDIAYAVQSTYFSVQKIERWLEWIKVWHATMVTPQGRLIPVIAAIGNHDLLGQFDQTPAQATVFSTLFPMPGKRIYNVLDFNSYLSVFILDSGHANSISGQQTQWLATALNERQHILHRLALYHVPAFPSARSVNNKHSVAIRRCWVPLFEKGGIQTAFEHHDHAYKRTYPLLNHRIHPRGVLYIGDGGWGVETPRSLRRKYPYLAKFASVRHFISVVLTPSEQHFKCIDDQGQVIDDYRHAVAQTAPSN